jgi:hypothetical protein
VKRLLQTPHTQHSGQRCSFPHHQTREGRRRRSLVATSLPPTTPSSSLSSLSSSLSTSLASVSPLPPLPLYEALVKTPTTPPPPLPHHHTTTPPHHQHTRRGPRSKGGRLCLCCVTRMAPRRKGWGRVFVCVCVCVTRIGLCGVVERGGCDGEEGRGRVFVGNLLGRCVLAWVACFGG